MPPPPPHSQTWDSVHQQEASSSLLSYDEPTPRADQTTFTPAPAPVRPAPTPVHLRHGPRAPQQRSTTSGESQRSASSGSADTGYSRSQYSRATSAGIDECAGPQYAHGRAATDFAPPPLPQQPTDPRPRVMHSRPPMPDQQQQQQQPRSVSDGSVTSPRYAHARAATDTGSQQDDRDVFPPRLVQQHPRSASGSSIGSPRNAHARAATDFTPSIASISESYQSPRPRHQQTADSSNSASSSYSHPAFQQRQQTVDTSTSSHDTRSPAKFSPPSLPLFRKQRQHASESSSSERHLKGKASASTLSPPTSPPATHATVQREPSQGWARVRTHVQQQQQQQQGKSKLFQFQQIWGRAAALSSSSDAASANAHARQPSLGLGAEPRSRLEEDVARALWAARFGHAAPERPKHKASQSVSNLNAGAGAAVLSVRPLAAALRPYIPPVPGPPAGHERQLSSASLDLDYGDADGREKPVLPREDDVLRVLACAPPEESEEAFEVFEMILRGWDAGSAKGHLDRALWLVRAARTTRYGLGAMVLRTLAHVLFYSPAARRWPVSSVAALQTLLAALLELQCALAAADSGVLLNAQGITNQAVDGECGALDMGDVERAYGVKASRADRAPSGAALVRKAVCRDAIVRALEHGAYGVRAWVLVNVLELEWDNGGDDDDDDPFEDEDEDEDRPRQRPPPAAATALQAHIAARATHRFLVVAPALLRSHDDAPRAALALLTSRILPTLQPDDPAAPGAVGVVLELLALREGAALVVGWCQSTSAWKAAFEAGLGSVIARADWQSVIRVVSALSSELTGDLRARAVGLAIPRLFDRLANSPMPHARDTPALAALLAHLSAAHKHLFYKPVIQCATAAKELTVIAHLRVLQALAKLLPDFWIADCELMGLALLGEAGRLGQSVLVLQVIEDVRARAGGKTSRAPPASQTQAVKFYTELETRIAVLTTAREKNTPLPFSHRLLIVALLLEIRQFTWSPRSPPWLPRVLNWALHSLPPDESAELGEVGATISKMRTVYMGCSDAQVSTARHSRSTLLFSPTSLQPVDQMLPAVQDESMSSFAALPSQLAAGCAKLLVLVSQLLTPSDTEQLGPVLWSRYLDSEDTSVLEPACFLVMHVAEWRPAFADVVRNDLQSPFSSVRRKAVRRISVLFAWRFQIMSQAFITDRSRRRPFHTTRRALSFVPVDVGSGNFVLEENEAELKARFGDALPRDTIRRLLEIDWVQENKPPDKRLELIRTPFSVLPSSQLDRGIEAAPETMPSPSASSSKIHTSSTGNLSPSSPGGSPGKPHLMRRKSSTSSSIGVVKRRPVFVHSLLGVLPALAVSVRDMDVFISSAARDLLVDFMREDAGTMCRPLMDTISSDGLQIVRVIDDIRAFLHVQQILPPAMSHIVFTHLAGFLRGVSRVEKDKALAPANNLLTFAYTVPILAKLVAQVSNLSAQDLRRAKAEVFLLPAGPLWFSSAAPLGPMFPRDLDEAGNVPQRDTLDEIPPALVAMTMIRTSQNMLLLALLKRNPQDITVVRKNLNRLVLPSREASSGLKQLVVGDFIPRSPEAMRSKSKDLGLARISIALSRSYLLLVAQIFRCLPRTLSDRAELGRLLDGVNRILLTHGDDIGIVSHALIACMVATTRFRRLFSSSSAFTLFMPSLIKVYCEATDQAGIRRAIEYAMSRFYQFHEDVVIFQTLDIASYMAAHPSAEPILSSLASGLVSLMSSLKSLPIAADGDAAGIHGINRDQEQEAWDAITIEKKPETLPLLLQSRAEASADAKSVASLDASQPKRFVTNNLVKFLLTIIAHDTSILRSEQFLRLLRCMTPFLYNMSASARTMLRDGINALGIAIFLRPAVPAAADIAAQARGLFASDYGDGGVLLGNPLTPCDFAVMRREYLRLIVGFSKAGGALHNPTMRRALDLVKSMLKDPSDDVFSLAERFIVDYIKASHAGDVYKDTNATVYQLREYAAIFQAWCHKCDFSGVLTVLDQLASNPTFAQDYAFSQMVMQQFLRPAVQACDRLAVEGTLFSSNLRLTVVPLLNTALTLSGTDPIGCIEQCNPSPPFLAGIVLPLCIKLRTSTEAAAQIVGIKPFTREAHARAWPRLLWYALEACNPAPAKATPGSRPSSRPSTPDGEKGRPSSAAQTPVATLAVVLQIVKIIVIRGESDLSACHRGVWDHLGAFLLDVLNGGNAEFGLRTSSMPRSISLVLSPGPRTASEPLPTPRALDYLMWSMMHLVCAHRSPLMVPVRLRILEVTAALHLELKHRLAASTSSPVRNTRRFSSSIFAKPRVRSLASTPVTPEMSPVASPQMTPTRTNPFAPRSPSYLSLASPPSAREATFRGRNRFPESVTPERTAGRRILHLGLAANQQQAMPLAPTSLATNTAGARAAALTLLNNLASVQAISSGTLVRACIRNVRMVQMFTGYELLLPLPESEDAFGEDQAWSEHATVLSKASALELVSRETALLIQEFRSEFYAALD